MKNEQLLREAFVAGYRAGRQLTEARRSYYGGGYGYGGSSYNARRAAERQEREWENREDEFLEDNSEKVDKLLNRMFKENPYPQKILQVKSFAWEPEGQTEDIWVGINRKYPEYGTASFYMSMSYFDDWQYSEDDVYKDLIGCIKVADEYGKVEAATVQNNISDEENTNA